MARSIKRIFVLLTAFGGISLNATPQQPTQAYAREILQQAAGLVPDVPEPQQMSVASNIANAQARAGDLPGALSTAMLLSKPQDQANALGSIAYFIDFSGDLNGALGLLDKAATGQNKDGTYDQLAWAHARKGDFSGAFRVAHLIQGDPSKSVEALNGIAEALWKSGDYAKAQSTWDDAIQVAKTSTKDQMDPAILLIGVAASRAKVGETAAASAALNDVYQTIAKRDTPDQGLHSILARAFAEIGELTSAFDIIKQLPSGSNRDICLMEVSSQLAKRNDTADAEEIAARISDAAVKNSALGIIASAELESGRSSSAIDAIEKISDLSGKPDALAALALEEGEKGDGAAIVTVRLASAAAKRNVHTPVYVFEQIAVTHAILGDFDLAEEMVRPLPSDARWWPWQNMTGILVASGDINAALKLAEEEKDAYPKACALLGIANEILSELKKTSSRDPSGHLNSK